MHNDKTLEFYTIKRLNTFTKHNDIEEDLLYQDFFMNMLLQKYNG
jgi:hypothetical protein